MKLLSLFLFVLSLNGAMIISPQEAMSYSYGKDAKVVKKNILLSKKQASIIQKEAKVKLKSKIFRIFKATKEDKLLGYGILVNKKVRSKNAVVLYFISDGVLRGIEIVAFNEPMEYLPSKNWNSQFEGVQTDKMLRVSKEIPTISGATLSARTITDGSRLAFALYNELLKDKE